MGNQKIEMGVHDYEIAKLLYATKRNLQLIMTMHAKSRVGVDHR